MRYLFNFVSNIKLLFVRCLSANLGRTSNISIYDYLLKIEHGVNSNKCLLNGMYPRHHKNIERIENLENDIKDIKYLVNDNISLSYIRLSLNNNAHNILELENDINDIKENIKALQLFLMEYNHCFFEKKKDK